jgi:hypothetical protein
MQWAGLPGGKLRAVRGDVPDATQPTQVKVATSETSRNGFILLY